MKLSVAASLLAAAALSAGALLPRQDEDFKCCFSLDLVAPDLRGLPRGRIRQDTIGELRLGGSFREAFLCLDTRSGTLVDGVGNSCFAREPSVQVQCFAGVPSDGDRFAFASGAGSPTQEVYLTLDGQPSFYACPVPGDGFSWNVFGFRKPDAADCLKIRLAQRQGFGACKPVAEVPDVRL